VKRRKQRATQEGRLVQCNGWAMQGGGATLVVADLWSGKKREMGKYETIGIRKRNIGVLWVAEVNKARIMKWNLSENVLAS